MHNHGVESAEKIKVELDKAIKRIVAIIDKGASEHPDLITKDHIREKITQLFDKKVGKKLDEKRLTSIYQDEGPKRFKQKIPPGYKDSEKGETRQFGDLVIWNEILEQACVSKRPVIFITSDTKEDWWWKQGQQTIGPRPELVHEVATVANTKFYMYNVERFLSEAQKRVDTNVESAELKKAAEEFKDIESKREGDNSITGFVEHWMTITKNPGPTFAGIAKALSSEVSDSRTVRELLEGVDSGASKIFNAGHWLFAVETIYDRPCTPVERSLIEQVIKRGDLEKIARGAKNCWDIAGALAVYVKTVDAIKTAES